MRVFCPECNTETEFIPQQYCCMCGSAWEPKLNLEIHPQQIEKANNSVWRYRSFFGMDDLDKSVSLGAGWTPLISTSGDGEDVSFKLEYISPTASFKDRGTEVEIAFLKANGFSDVVEDSSGNAGASIAAYGAKAGLSTEIYAPASASPAKLAQIEIYGATLKKIPGPRIEATKAVLNRAEEGSVYASHAYNPVYLLGQQTFAWEVWEQTGGQLPDALIIPVGQCGLLLGAWLGFKRLLEASIINRMPRLFAAQPEILAPIHFAMKERLDDIPEITPKGKSIADGLAIVKPVRSKRILQALRESEGGAITVSETEIKNAYFALGKKGMFVEPSSAVAAAAIPKVKEQFSSDVRVLVALTGSGMKAPLLVK